MPQNLDFKSYKFEDFSHAALKLSELFSKEQAKEENWLFLAISKEALYIASFLADKFGCDFDIIFIEPIFAPNNKECVVAMVSETEDMVGHKELIEAFGISMDYLYGEMHRRYEEDIIKLIYSCKGVYDLKEKIANRDVVLIDTGCESGLRMFTAVKSLISNRAKSVKIGVPVMPKDIYKEFLLESDGIYYLYLIEDFIETSFYYKNYDDVSCEDLKEILKKRNKKEN